MGEIKQEILSSQPHPGERLAGCFLGYNSTIQRRNTNEKLPFKKVPMDVAALFTRIEKVIEVNAGTIVLENPSGFPRNETNLYLVDRRGEILWRAEKPDPYTYFSRVKLNEDGDTFSAYTLGGHACELELRTGKLISFTKLQ